MTKRLVAGLAIAALLAACASPTQQSASPTASMAAGPSSPSASTASAATSPSASASAAPVATPTASASVAPEPTSALEPFTCDLPESIGPTVDRAHIVDVRIGSHGGGPPYDRIVFEFREDGIPEFTLRAGRPPFTYDPSGLPLRIRGRSFLVMVLHGGTGLTPEGEETYDGPTQFLPDFPKLRELEQAGDFEAVSEWVVGMSGPACHRLFVLRAPTRIVLDLEQDER